MRRAQRKAARQKHDRHDWALQVERENAEASHAMLFRSGFVLNFDYAELEFRLLATTRKKL
jgi:hypothetical protein